MMATKITNVNLVVNHFLNDAQNKSTWDVHEGVKKVDNIKSSYENIHDRKIVKNDKIQQYDCLSCSL